MNGGVAPALRVETAFGVQIPKIVLVGVAPKKIQVGDLKVAPVVAHVPLVARVVVLRDAQQAHEPADGCREPHHLVQRVPVGGARDALFGAVVVRGFEQGRDGLAHLPERDCPAVDLTALGHLGEGVVGQGAAVAHAGLETPVPFVWFQGFEVVEFAVCRYTKLAQGTCYWLDLDRETYPE